LDITNLATTLKDSKTAHIGCATYGTDIYLFGGVAYSNGLPVTSKQSDASKYVYKFNTLTKEITQCKSLPYNTYYTGAVTIGDRIYCFFGTGVGSAPPT
jgi:hypothetical protein